jgi:hypothetical protein
MTNLAEVYNTANEGVGLAFKRQDSENADRGASMAMSVKPALVAAPAVLIQDIRKAVGIQDVGRCKAHENVAVCRPPTHALDRYTRLTPHPICAGPVQNR